MNESEYDVVVMLTWSNWFSELRSNRYHYASRFSKKCPVLFVQPDLEDTAFQFENTEIPNVTVLHLYCEYNQVQVEIFNRALLERKFIKPLFWIYNGYFSNILMERYFVLSVYHGTEDYLSPESMIKMKNKVLLQSFDDILKTSNLLVSVSDGVANSFSTYSSFKGETITVTNGCDFKFYAPESIDQCLPSACQNIAFYQGNIFDKLDYALLIALAKRMPAWSFQFCGKIIFNEKLWQILCELPNVTYLGLLTPEAIRNASYKATVGLIPFVENEWLIERSFPLKSFEYLACGLPVVSVPIKALLPYHDVIEFASGIEQFEKALSRAASLKRDPMHFQKRLDAAGKQDYDLKFQSVENKIQEVITQLKSNTQEEIRGFNVLVLYKPEPEKFNSLLAALTHFSIHSIAYCPVLDEMPSEVDLKVFDALVIDVSLVSGADLLIHTEFIEKIRAFSAYKLLISACRDFPVCCQTLGIHQIFSFPLPEYTTEVQQQDKHLEDRKVIHAFDLLLSTALSARVPVKKLIYAIVGYQDETENYIYNKPASHFFFVPSHTVYSMETINKPQNIDMYWTTGQLFSAMLHLQRQLLCKLLLNFYQNRFFTLKQIIKKILPEQFKSRLRKWLVQWARR